MRRRRDEDEFRWRELGTYNAEVARGIMHTSTWKDRMAREQELFDKERRGA